MHQLRRHSGASETRKFKNNSRKLGGRSWVDASMHLASFRGASTAREPGIHRPCADEFAVTPMILDHIKRARAMGAACKGTGTARHHAHRAYGFRAHRFAMPRNDGREWSGAVL